MAGATTVAAAKFEAPSAYAPLVSLMLCYSAVWCTTWTSAQDTPIPMELFTHIDMPLRFYYGLGRRHA